MSLLKFAFVLCCSVLLGAQEPPLQKPERSGRNDGRPNPLACARYVGQANRAEIAATPRADVDLERLALNMGGTFTAGQTIYNRVVADVAAVRTARPQLGFTHRGANDGRGIVIEADAATFEQMQAGRYRGWDCADDLYRVVGKEFLPGLRFVFVRFKGLYDTQKLATEYARLPGVTLAEANNFVGDGSDICGTVADETHHYVFDLASGDCPSGCINHQLFYFTTTPGTAPRFGGEWRRGDGTPPDWARRYGKCFRFIGN